MAQNSRGYTGGGGPFSEGADMVARPVFESVRHWPPEALGGKTEMGSRTQVKVSGAE